MSLKYDTAALEATNVKSYQRTSPHNLNINKYCKYYINKIIIA